MTLKSLIGLSHLDQYGRDTRGRLEERGLKVESKQKDDYMVKLPKGWNSIHVGQPEWVGEKMLGKRHILDDQQRIQVIEVKVTVRPGVGRSGEIYRYLEFPETE